MSRIVIAVSAAFLLSACGLDPRGGYRPVRDNAPSFDQVNAVCWERSMSLLGGLAMDSPREAAYDACMRQNGWADPRRTWQQQPATTPASSGR